MRIYLTSDANIVHNWSFSNAVVKVMNGIESELTCEKLKAIKDLGEPIEGPQNSGSRNENFSYYDRIEQKRCRLSSACSNYAGCSFIPATSRSVERLSSASSWVLTCARKHMSPILDEGLLLLKLNHGLWDKKKRLFCNERYTQR